MNRKNIIAIEFLISKPRGFYKVTLKVGSLLKTIVKHLIFPSIKPL